MKITTAATTALLLTTLSAFPSHAASIPAPTSIFDQHPSSAPTVNPAPVLELYVTLTKDRVNLGMTDNGERTIVPITGGYFLGKDISGEVVAGGADWQTIRQDGIKEIYALYSIRTDDGSTIIVDNRGIVSNEGGTRYAITRPVFHAPVGKYDWLNKKLFVGTITSIKQPRAVVIRVYEVN